jgi:hypothetical protein
MHSFRYIKTFICLVAIAIFTFSCQESYIPDDLESNQIIPVFEGSLTDEPGPYSVTISQAKPFSSTSYSTVVPINNAKVYIKDDKGGTEELKDPTKIRGIYTSTTPNFRGIVGRKYRLYVRLSNNYIYESIPTLLKPAEKLDSIYAETGTYDYTTTTYDGDIIMHTYVGINVYADINTESEYTDYYKFSNILVWQTMRTEGMSTPMPYPVYYRQIINPNNLPDVKASILYGNQQVVKKHLLLFIPYVPDPNYSTDSLDRSPYSNMGWVLLTQMKTISKETHDYYKTVYNQLMAGSQLFDPIPSQIKGNIVCKTDTTKLAIGLFDVYTRSSRNRAFYWAPTSKNNKVLSKEVFDPGPMLNDTFSNIPAPYWVSF